MPNAWGKTECQVISEWLPHHHDGKFGYVIYRCVYGDDDEWACFIQRLKEYVHAALDRQSDDGHMIKDCLAWDVQENQTELNGASKTEVRNKFRSYIASLNGPQILTVITRYTKCIYADADVVASVLEREDPSSEAPSVVLRPKAFLYIINAKFKDVIKPGDPEEFPDDPEALRRYNEGDEGFPPIEGCRRHDVGWMKVPARELVPYAYEQLLENGWHLRYVRPPGMYNA